MYWWLGELNPVYIFSDTIIQLVSIIERQQISLQWMQKKIFPHPQIPHRREKKKRGRGKKKWEDKEVRGRGHRKSWF